MGKGYKTRQRAIMLSIALCIGASSTTGIVWAQAETVTPPAATPAAVPAAPAPVALPAAATVAPPAPAPVSAPSAAPETAAASPAPVPVPVATPVAPPAPAATAPAAVSEPTSEATETAPAAPKKAKKEKVVREEKSKKEKNVEQGYYGTMYKGTEVLKHELDRDEQAKRHQGAGYYSTIPSTPEKYPEIKRPDPPPVVVAPVPTVITPPRPVGPDDRRFDDDTGGTGSITATRHAKQANELLQSGHYELAKKHFKESLRDHPEQANLYPGYWETCAHTNDWSEALRSLNKMFELNPALKKDYLWALGQALYELRRWESATATLKESLKYGKNLEEVHTYLLKIAQNERNTPQIIAEYTALIKMKPGDYKLQLELANLLELEGRHADAISRYKSASTLNPSDGALLARVAYMIMYYNKDFSSAINFYQKASSADPANAGKYNDSVKYCMQQIKMAKKSKNDKSSL